MMNENVLGRVQEIVEQRCGGSSYRLSQVIGESQQSCSNWCTGKSALHIKFLLALLRNYEDISAEWLMRGEGSMVKPKTFAERAIETLNKYTSCGSNDSYYESLLDMRDKRIRDLEREVASLRAALNSVQRD